MFVHMCCEVVVLFSEVKGNGCCILYPFYVLNEKWLEAMVAGKEEQHEEKN